MAAQRNSSYILDAQKEFAIAFIRALWRPIYSVSWRHRLGIRLALHKRPTPILARPVAEDVDQAHWRGRKSWWLLLENRSMPKSSQDANRAGKNSPASIQ